MNATVSAQPAIEPEIKRLLAQQLTRGTIFIAIQAAILFAVSGRLNWVGAWLYVGYSFVSMVCLARMLARRDPALVKERVAAFKQADNWDKPLATFLAFQAPLILCLVAGLDSRFHWSYPPRLGVQAVALAVAVFGDILKVWAMVSNRFFSSIVRIQTERGHSVTTGGPYRFVRHPGYVGMLIRQLAVPVMLGTLWAFLAAGMVLLVMFLRTALEDQLLHRELPGYKEYAERVSYRLIPGIW